MSTDDVQCINCTNPIGCNVYVQCNECEDFILCLHCFSHGVELGSHTRDHGYMIMDNGTFPLMDCNWLAIEELALLEAIEQHGMGNWDGAADQLRTKTPRESREHYENYYVYGNIGKATRAEKRVHPVDHVQSSVATQCEANTEANENMTLEEQQELGYMPLRDDFEREFKNEAEELVTEISFSNDEPKLESGMLNYKIAQTEIYCRDLKDRQRRKNIARQADLLSGKHKRNVIRRKLSKEEKKFRIKMKPFVRLKSGQENERFYENYFKEKQLKERIKKLQSYRKSGITKLADCEDFDDYESNRESKKKMKKKKLKIQDRPLLLANRKEENFKPDGNRSNGDLFNNIKHCKGFSLLSINEKKLCHALSLKPPVYISVKTSILKEFATKRHKLPMGGGIGIKIEKSKRQQILKFLNESGVIKFPSNGK
ncbi:Transcriptional adapter 2-beta [Trichoplax sp. H2]|nr:Transcriptional adapter 2-beta [Trichoplax sp. H2]|eukprot:RDD44288.1 Transcriptional adapter 2-beta [Trichoplax sp. H2]